MAGLCVGRHADSLMCDMQLRLSTNLIIHLRQPSVLLLRYFGNNKGVL